MPDEYGDQTELEIITEQGQLEAFQFGGLNEQGHFHPARWLNPPHPVDPLVILDWARTR